MPLQLLALPPDVLRFILSSYVARSPLSHVTGRFVCRRFRVLLPPSSRETRKQAREFCQGDDPQNPGTGTRCRRCLPIWYTLAPGRVPLKATPTEKVTQAEQSGDNHQRFLCDGRGMIGGLS